MDFVKSKTDLFRLIDNEAQTSTSKMVLFLILGTIFLDAYDITILGTMTDQLTQQFHLSPATLSIVMTSLPIGALFGCITWWYISTSVWTQAYFINCLTNTHCNLSWCGTRTKCNYSNNMSLYNGVCYWNG